MSKSSKVQTYIAAAQSLQTIIQARKIARADFDAARDDYDDRRQALILSGIPGQRQEARVAAQVRDAELERALCAELTVLRAARDHLRTCDADWEAARVEERLQREVLRPLSHAQ